MKKLSFFLISLFFSLSLYASEAIETRFNLAGMVLGQNKAPFLSNASQLLKECRLRTHVDPSENAWMWVNSQTIHKAPPFLWILVGSKTQVNDALVSALQSYILAGGTIFIEANSQAASKKALVELRKKVFFNKIIKPLRKDALLTRTYYILPTSSSKFVETYTQSGRIIWIESKTTVLSYIQAQQNPQREQKIRLAINVILYTLTGSYKDDLTHLKYLMRRKKH